MQPDLGRALAAELIGTFALVFAGAGAIMVNEKTGALGHVGIAITFGLVIMAMIYAVGHVSGAHFNPAVSFAFALSRHFPWPRAAAYWAAQITGALLAALVLRGSLGDIAHVGATLPSGSQRQSFLWEVVLTFFLMFVIMAVATDTRAVGEAAAIAVGGTVALDAMFGGPISGASMNPARSLGPAVVSGDLHALWLYLTAPLVGAALGALAYQFVRGEQDQPVDASGSRGTSMNVLFVCVANSGRSLIAERFLRELAGDRHQARSAGSEPGGTSHPQVVEALREVGIDASDHVPRKLDQELLAWADVAVSTCNEEVCPVTPGVRRISWEFTDPKHLPLEQVREIRDQIKEQVRELVVELDRESEER